MELLLNNKKQKWRECEEYFSAGVSNCSPIEVNNSEYLSSSECDETSINKIFENLNIHNE